MNRRVLADAKSGGYDGTPVPENMNTTGHAYGEPNAALTSLAVVTMVVCAAFCSVMLLVAIGCLWHASSIASTAAQQLEEGCKR